jgi:two-component system, chemotaxis family, sensor histidine kinase and response regulator PixL
MASSSIREQTYSYFLAEAQDLLQSLEQDLLSLRQERSPAKVHNLMRSAHTLKGAAASVGFDSMKAIAHSLEDVVKALYKPEVKVDAEFEGLLFEAYECLRSPIAAVLAGTESNDSELLARSEVVFEKLRKKLGKHFDPGAAIPTSSELGFDITRSLFETGVRERLEQLAIAIEKNQQVTETLTTHAEVFVGLAESLNLPGFGAIAETTLKALQQNPEKTIEIAQAALADFRQGQIAVLGGDRTRGGEVSAALKQLSRQAKRQVANWNRVRRFLNRPVVAEPSLPKLPAAKPISEPAEIFDPASIQSALETLASSFETSSGNGLAEVGFEVWDDTPAEGPQPQTPEIVPQQAEFRPAPPLEAPAEPSAGNKEQRVRVDLEHLDALNYTTSELLIHQNQQTLQDEKLYTIIHELVEGLRHHQHTLLDLRDLADRMLIEGTGYKKKAVSENRLKAQFDVLELDRHDELRELVQSALEELVPLELGTDVLENLLREANLTHSKQGRLLHNLRDDLMTIRMIPIGTVLNRIPRVVDQLMQQYDKQVELRLSGSPVLVDKAIAERLYDPLLHLVRNAFDHGIESAQKRHQSGKPGLGRIEVNAYQQGNRTIIDVRDDGYGLDLTRICRRGFEMGLIPSDQVSHFSEVELFNLLFEPGFSTAKEVSDLSGRGVGLDVVRSQLRAMKGNISVSSSPSQGTTFSLQLPLTIMSARLLVCQAGPSVYGLLSDDVEKILMPTAKKIDFVGGKRVFHWEQEGEEIPVPLYRLSQLMQYTTSFSGAASGKDELMEMATLKQSESTVPVLLLRRQSEWIGLEVERVLGEQELVIRPMGSAIAPPPYVYGCSILGDQRLILVIDGAGLSELGATFRPESPTPIAPPPPPPLKRTRTRVLVVDDSVTVRQMVSLTLQGAGYEVVQAQDGLDAIAQLEKHPDIKFITCDVEMPRLNGFEFLMRYSQEAGITHVPVVMLTSRSNDKHQQLAMQLGASAYMTKPFSDERLLQLADELIGAGRN